MLKSPALLIPLLRATLLAVGFVAVAGGPKAADVPASPAVPFFEARVRPVLLARCDECHGADTAEGGLRVDSRDSLLRGGKSGPAMVPGDPEASLLIQAIRHSHKSLRMPKRREKLPPTEIEGLVRWIQEGAEWPTGTNVAAIANRKIDVAGQREFWSLRPLSKPSVPTLRDAAWPKADLDRHVLARLEKAGLTPVAPARKETLIRRATLDLTGLPPTRDEVRAFLEDNSPEAFSKVVDRLLASPQYGETWGRWWLDVARYGEDDCRSLDPMQRGYNPYPNAHLYRDWVVQALNDDLPYDQFVIQQLAGDLLDDKGRAGRLPALGFLGLGPWLYDNGSVEVTRANERHDRVDTISRGLLGLTIACARCHDHKYDAISSEDYYALASVFKNTVYHEYPQVPQSVVDDFKQLEKRVEDKEKLLAEVERNARREVAADLALQTSKYLMAAWSVLGELRKDKGEVVAQEKLDHEVFNRWLAFLAKPPKHYKDLEKWQAMLAARGSKDEAKKLADEFQETVVGLLFEERDLDEENEIIRAKALPGTRKKKKANLPHEFITNDDFCPGCGLQLRTLKDDRNNLSIDLFHHDLDKELDFAQAAYQTFNPGVLTFEGPGLERHLGPERLHLIESLREDIKKGRKELDAKFPYVHGVADAATPSPIQLHVRGNPFRLGAVVPARFPQLLSPEGPREFTRGSGRLELARAIVAHPITARVIANRIWKWHFGTGISDTPGDFGITGERPTNPELLEYLAWLLVDQGMSLKKFHRAILLSSTYQLSDADFATNAAIDSGNRLHWRYTPRRLTAEQIRDTALAAAGTLELKLGGPPEKLTTTGTRRTIYGQVSRYKLDEYLALFDFPSPNASAERRFTTQVPLQRLFLMNSDFMQQQAELLARRATDETNTTARIQRIYSLLFARDATESEVAAGKAFLAEEPMRAYAERKAFREKEEAEAKDKPGTKSAEAKREDKEADGKPAAAGMMAGVGGDGESTKPATKPLPVTVEGRYCKVLMSSHEFLFVR